MRSLFSHLRSNFKNIAGFTTTRKIIVFESDDWGSIRMPSSKVFNILQKRGLDLTSGDSYRFNLYDTLASPSDLLALFETLSSFRDRNNHQPVFTAMCIVANPAFDKIRESGYSQYFYEPFTETLMRYYGDDKVYNYWKEGMNSGIFIPQYHGREHLNVPLWLKSLHDGDWDTRLAFDHGFWGYKRAYGPVEVKRFQAAFGFLDGELLEEYSDIIRDGLDLFEGIFGYRAEYFVPPNGLLNNRLEKVLHTHGIKYRSVAKIQHEPFGHGKYRKVIHFTGQKNKYGQVYLIRNSVFEPSRPGIDWVDSCLKDINVAFRWNKPAIINTHRVNYIGELDISNRDRGIRQLNRLLKKVIKIWPDVEFMSSVQLASIIT